MRRVAARVALALDDAHDRAAREACKEGLDLAVHARGKVGVAEGDEVLEVELPLKQRAHHVEQRENHAPARPHHVPPPAQKVDVRPRRDS